MDFLLLIIVIVSLVILIVCIVQHYLNDHRSRRDKSGGAMRSLAGLANKIPQMIVLDTIFPLMDRYKTTRRSKAEYSGNKLYREFYSPIFDKLSIDVAKYKNFIDICCNPGALSIKILESNDNITGYGLSLPPSKHGYEASAELDRFKDRFNVIYFDILTDDSAILPRESVDFACISCFPKHNENAENITLNLYAKAFTIAIDRFHAGSDLYWVFPFRWSPSVLLNVLKLLREHFGRVDFYKDEIATPGLAVAHIMATGFKEKKAELIRKYERGEDLFDDKFVDYYKRKINDFMKSLAVYHIKLIDPTDRR
jgi:hypothetical protein